MNFEKILSEIMIGIAHKPVIVEREYSETMAIKLIVTPTDPADIPILIGKAAITIKSIQSLFKAIGKINKVHITVDLVNESKERRFHEGYKPGWTDEKAIAFADMILDAMQYQVVHQRSKKVDHCLGLIIQPELPEPLFTSVHSILKQYGQSHCQCFGLMRDE